ncbi:unnamed protein product [Ambrosiozyma monospora]|uniref:Unnamed protein product n=1 Tax=Ambrosiozyma monospora TaxID=43982 RepID=A0A9W6YV05_AMBMO|nr:unnamed protein product [Ambrosiozyma monospora]
MIGRNTFSLIQKTSLLRCTPGVRSTLPQSKPSFVTAFNRFQSSSSKARRSTNLLSNSVSAADTNSTATAAAKSTTKKSPEPQKTKKGFNSLSKVPSTISIKPKEILLDNLFQGYKPLTIPLNPPPKSNFGKQSAVVYFEFDENLEDLLNDQDAGDQTSQITASFANEAPQPRSNNKFENKNLTRYQYSNYSFNKELEIHSDYDLIDGDVDADLKPHRDSKKSAKYNKKTLMKSKNSLSSRSGTGRVGRTRVQYNKKITNTPANKGKKNDE